MTLNQAAEQTHPMSRTGDQWIEKTGGLSFGETPDMLPAKVEMIEELERRIVSPETSVDEREELMDRLRALKGLPPVEFDPPDDDDE